ncbi:acyl-CoA thioesterase [Brumimicrobium aurantiacum]|uniref:Acyl-CoA thioesterase n=1 Tax=Brumimicrobium aurantiacum TaxID=1737063 RepID=A0A3E1EZB8_9FLAO|nr:acyl-CoA thioesterase [Brumimicrobium aurantiacum]RFC54912.1 acyl-CoA thioesterase [Brumimicrobium aurantiacum]
MRKRSTNYKKIDHLTTTFSARVKFNEADPLGIVWHGNYVSYFEEGREAFGREHGITYLDINNHGFSIPIVRMECDNKFPLKYGDTYTIKTHVLDCPAAKIIHTYEIYNQDGVLACEGKTIQVFVNKEGALSLTLPKFYEEWKNKVNFKS